jgi:hypothetical protein
MSLVGVPLLVLAAALAVGAVAATVWGWRRGGRWRLLTRPLGVLLSQALILISAGLVVNRSEEFYPSWAALAGQQEAEVVAPAVPDGRLDDALRARAVPGRAVTVPWRPDGVAAWHLAGPATVVVPPDYLSRSTAAFPVVVSLVSGPPGSTSLTPATGSPAWPAGSPVLLNAPASDRTAATDIAGALPGRLAADLRTTGHGWVLVAAWHQAGLAARAVASAPGRFTAVALIAAAPPVSPAASPAVSAPVSPAASPAAPPTVLPVAPSGVTPPGFRVSADVAVAVARDLSGALAWAMRQAPPVLAPPVVLPPLVTASLPAAVVPATPAAVAPSAGRPTKRGRPDVTGQPGS